MNNDSPHIVHICTGLGNGGAEAILYQLCLSDRSNTHHVVSLMDEGKYGAPLREHGVEVTCLNMPQGRITLKGVWNLFRLLRANRSAVVQTWMGHANLLGGVVAKLTGIKKIFWGVHHTAVKFTEAKLSTAIIGRLCGFLSTWLPSKIIFCAEKSMTVHLEIGYCAEKSIVIQNGYDVSEFSIKDLSRQELRGKWKANEKVIIGSVGRFHPLKDHRTLLKAMSLIKRQNFSFHCVLVGSGMLESNEELMRWITELDLQDKVSLLGQRNDIPDIMNAIDVLVLSSVSEAFPNVLSEAMACGTPCITTDVGDAASIVGESGWVVPHSIPEAIADALVEALAAIEDRENWWRRRIEARKHIKDNFSLKKMINSYNTVWRA